MFGTYCRLDLPISATALDVIRATRRKFKRAARSDRAQRDARHAVYRAMLRHHAAAGGLAARWRL